MLNCVFLWYAATDIFTLFFFFFGFELLLFFRHKFWVFLISASLSGQSLGQTSYLVLGAHLLCDSNKLKFLPEFSGSINLSFLFTNTWNQVGFRFSATGIPGGSGCTLTWESTSMTVLSWCRSSVWSVSSSAVLTSSFFFNFAVSSNACFYLFCLVFIIIICVRNHLSLLCGPYWKWWLWFNSIFLVLVSTYMWGKQYIPYASHFGISKMFITNSQNKLLKRPFLFLYLRTIEIT